MPESPGPEFPDGPEFPEFTEDELTSVTFDEEFVRAARMREPSAAERAVLPVGGAPDEGVPGRDAPGDDIGGDDDAFDPFTVPDGDGPGLAAAGGPAGADGPWRRARHPGRWRRGVAWVLALVMGVGVVAVALSAVFRTTSSGGTPSPRSPQPAAGSVPASPAPGPRIGPLLTTALSASPAGGG